MSGNDGSAFKIAGVQALLATAIVANPLLAAEAQASNARCKIVASSTATQTSLNAQILASGNISGVYVLEVTSPSDGTQLAFRQSKFDVDGEDAIMVLDEEIKVSKGGGYDASLLVEWPGGSSSCSASGN